MIRQCLNRNPIMAAANYDKVEAALASNAEIIVLMNGTLAQLLEGRLEEWNKVKPIYIHMDLLKGLGNDHESLVFIKEVVKVSGIISTKNNSIRCAKKIGLSAIQRIFLIDTRSLTKAVESSKTSNPDAIEIMPGIATAIIPTVKEMVDIPIIMSGLISDEKDVEYALACGADGVSMSLERLWQWRKR